MAAKEVVRLGVVGGRRGAAIVEPARALSDKVAVTAICDLDQKVLDSWADRHPGIATFDDYGDMLANGDCDAVFIATPYPLHAEQALMAMAAGKHVLSEVVAATTLDECRRLVEAVERSGLVYMMAENYCFTRQSMMVLEMVERGVFGQPVYAEGAYIHDCRPLMFTESGELTWRGRLRRGPNRNTYPTHSLGPVALWLGVNRTDRLKTVSNFMTPSVSARRYAEQRFGPDHPLARDPSAIAIGDSATTVIQTERGAVIVLRVDWASARPHNMHHYVLQGTTAAYVSARRPGEDDLVWLEGRSPTHPNGTAAEWEPLAAYAEEFEHPDWRQWGEVARSSGHGGGDFFVLKYFLEAILSGTRPPVDVYDAVTWSSIVPLSAHSSRLGGAPVEVPDFQARHHDH